MYIPEVMLRAPVQLGPPSRVFREYWPNWGIKYSSVETAAVLAHGARHFAEEYQRSPDRMPSISTATKVAFGQDYPQLLNESNASVVSQIILQSRKRLSLLDFGTGSGNSVETLFERVVRAGGRWEWNKVNIIVVEPSQHLLEATSRKLRDLGIETIAIPILLTRFHRIYRKQASTLSWKWRQLTTPIPRFHSKRSGES